MFCSTQRCGQCDEIHMLIVLLRLRLTRLASSSSTPLAAVCVPSNSLRAQNCWVP